MGKWIHRLSDINTEDQTALCAECGTVGIYKSPGGKNWVCRNKKRDDLNKYYKKYPWKHKQAHSPEAKAKRSARMSRRNAVIRLECIEYYGGKCIACGDMNTNHLTFDHINNDGKEQRKTIPTSRFPRYLKRMGYPDYIQLLCWNHNLEKSIYGVMTI